MEAVIEKIQKILSRATNNANTHEAELAMKMAQELLIKHNLSMQDVNGKPQTDYTLAENVDKSGKIPPEVGYILQILSEYFFVKAFYTRHRSYVGRDVSVSFVGKPENIEVAKYVYFFLRETYRTLYRQFLDQFYGTGVRTQKYVHSFYQGLTNGLWHKLRTERIKISDELGLVLVKDPGIDNFLNSLGDMRQQKMSRSGEQNALAQSVGTQQGSKISINPAIGTRKDQVHLLN